MNLVTALPTDVCEGAQITMTVSTTTASSTHNGTYSWYRNNMLVDENQTNTFIDSPMTVDNDTTTYIYTANFVEDLTGCTASISDTVVVYKNLNVVLSGDQYICAGQDIVLEANVNGHQIASESLVVNWYRDGADAGGSISYIPQSTSVLTLPTTTADIQDAPYMFNVEASRGQGCLSTSEPYAVYVYGNPDVEITYDDNTVCVGGYTTLHATLAGSDENITYKWEEGGTTISGATTDTYVASFVSTGTKTFKAIVINALTLCSDTATININVVADPEISAIEIDRDTVCNGYQVTVNATATGGVADPYTYTWFKNGEVIEGATGSVIYDTPEAQGSFATRYIYGVSVSQASVGCVSEIKYDTVYIMPNPSVVISGDAVICDNDSIRLNANVNDYNETMGALAYQWKENNVDLTDASATTNRLGITRGQQDEPYIYTVVVTNETDGCSTTSDPYYVYVNDSVMVELTLKKLESEFNISYDTLYDKYLKYLNKKEVKKEVLKKKELTFNKYEMASRYLIYYMLKDENVLNKVCDSVTYFKEKNIRGLYSEIVYYYHKYGRVNIADIISYFSDKEELLRELMKIINMDIKEEYSMEEIDDYIKVVNYVPVEDRIKELNIELKKESNPLKQANILSEIMKLKGVGKND